MPELPEVEVVRAGLAPAVDGARIESVEVLDERSVRRHDEGAANFEAKLLRRKFATPMRRGKFLWLPFADVTEEALLAHLGMSGQMLLREPGAAPDRHTRVRLAVAHPEHGSFEVRFVDQRIFGYLAVRALVDGVPDLAAHIALDPIDADFDVTEVAGRLRRRRQGVKAALLDQTLVSGIGNIYADEALWRARLYYATPGERISRVRALELFGHVRDVLDLALAEGGTSFDAQYVNVNGQAGYFAHSLNAYGREGQGCPRCGTPIVRDRFMNRSSHFCPWCQRKR